MEIDYPCQEASLVLFPPQAADEHYERGSHNITDTIVILFSSMAEERERSRFQVHSYHEVATK